MALPNDGPCGAWIDWADVTGCCRADLSTVVEADQARHMLAASEVLWNLSKRKYPGHCTATRSFCVPSVACGGCRQRCRCGPLSRIDLGPQWAVASVEVVLVDGVELLEGVDYRVDDWRWLVRLDSETWPVVTDLTDPEALEVTWTYGRAVPEGGKRAAARLACEFAAACIPGVACNLPQRYITVEQREGTTYTFVDSLAMLRDGQTGIYDVDLWINSDAKGDEATGGIFDPGACQGAHALDTGTPAS